jgi:hypothetical protein
VALEAAWRALRNVPVGRVAEGLQAVLLIALVVASAGGLGLVVGGGQPSESLHHIYAVIALGIMPLGSAFTRRARPRTRALVTLGAALVALVVIGRLFQTG